MINRIIRLSFSMIVLLCIGLVYGWSIFVAPLENEFGWERSETSLTFTISMCSLCLGLLAGGQMNKNKHRTVLTLSLAGILIFSGFVLASTIASLTGFYVFYGMFTGFGTGLAYVEIISIGSRIFPDKQGLTSGLLMMCFGLGGLILGTICSTAMAAVGWRVVFRVIGISFGIFVMLEGFILKTKEPSMDSKTNDIKEDSESYSTFQMVGTASFKLLYLWLILLSAAGLAVMGHIAPCMQALGSSATTAAMITGMVSLCNGLGRVISGILYDRFSFDKVIYFISVAYIAASIMGAIAMLLNSSLLMAAASVLMGLCFGGAPSSSSAIVIQLYGNKFFSSNFGAISTQVMFASLLGPYVAGKMYSMSNTYSTTFYMIVAFSILSFAIAMIFIKLTKYRKVVYS